MTAPSRNALASPTVFLISITFVNWLGFASWQALFNNFAKDAASFTGWEIGVLQSVREIPGFLAFTAVFWFMIMREQTLAYVEHRDSRGRHRGHRIPALLPGHPADHLRHVGGLPLLRDGEPGAVASAPAEVRGPEGARQGRERRRRRPARRLWAHRPACSGAFKPSYQTLYLGFGLGTAALALAAWRLFPRFQGDVPQRKGIVLRRRYWLYYALTFLSGARRQLFMAFGGWLLVENFGYDLAAFSALLFIYCAINLVAGPLLGRLIARIGERATIILENVSLIVVFTGYALTTSGWLAGALFVADGVFFTLTIAQRTYFQKISDAADIAPTASVAFTINHIAAVAIPVLFGRIWIQDPTLVFGIGACIATASLALAFLVPRHPEPGAETVLGRAGRVVPAE